MSELDGRCGSCGAFTRVRTDPVRGRVGECALQVYPPPVLERSTCSRYRPRGAAAPPPPPRAAGQPRSRTGPVTSHRTEASPTARVRPPLPQEIDIDMEASEFRRVLREVLSEELGLGDVELGGRWEGGELILKPGREGTQEKRVPLDQFFAKIVMIRDKLRVLEQKINAHSDLSAADKVQLQSYITGCYGTLTTFNLLFAKREDGFTGAGKDE